MNRILVTGGAGFIGSHTCVLLLKKGYEVIIVDSFINSFSNTIERINKICSSESCKGSLKVFNCDLRNKNKLRKIFKNYYEKNKRIGSVIHFAGLKSVYDSVRNPMQYWDVNVSGTLILLDIMREFECFCLVFSSSATIYGNPKEIPISENAISNPLSPYGSTKLAVESILTELYKSNTEKFRFAILRYFNPVGAHKTGLIGENPLLAPTNLFPLINKVALGEIDYLNIFGTNWDTEDGTPIRDYIHVMDLASGHLCALEYMQREKSDILKINLGTGKGFSVLEIIKTFENCNKVEVPYKFVDRREGDIAVSVANNQVAKSVMNWEPKLNLEDMCKDSWKWTLMQKKFKTSFY